MPAFTAEEHKLFQEALEKYGEGTSGTEWQSIVAHCRKTELEARARARAFWVCALCDAPRTHR